MKKRLKNNTWFPMEKMDLVTQDPLLSDWVKSPASLTKRLKDHTQNKIQFCLHKQSWLTQEVWCREISWQYEGKNWILAKTLIPKVTLDQFKDTLQQNPGRPIGEILFSNASWRRSEMRVCRIDSESSDYQWAKAYQPKMPESLIMRDSTFTSKKRNLTVMEIFLPEFLHE